MPCVKRFAMIRACPGLRARLGSVFAAMGSPARAQQMFLRDLRDDPGNVDTLLEYGELLLELGRLPDAAEKFRRILEFEPANVDAHARLGHIALRSNLLDQAGVEFDLVYKLEPEYPQVRLDLATVKIELGMPEEARRCLREELEQLRLARVGAAALRNQHAPLRRPVVAGRDV